MYGYYLNLAVRSFRRNRMLTALMVIAIALGIGASMTTLTVFHILSGDPLPGRSQLLFYPQLDSADMEEFTPGEEPEDQMTRHDAEELLRQKRADRQAVMKRGNVLVKPQSAELGAFSADARYTSSDFFPMFAAPFKYGNGWDAAEDDARSRIAVISSTLNDKLFGGQDSVGKTVQVNQNDLRIVGVLDDWRPTPKFYDLYGGLYGEVEQVFIPFSTSRDLKLDVAGRMHCWGENDFEDDPEGPTSVNSPCAWLQYWVQLDSPAKVEAYRQYLTNYSDQQRAAGRFQRPTNVRLRGLMEWLDHNKVVPGDVRLQMWLAFGFLVVCLLNTSGLLLAKFLRRSSEIGVRRALGASRRAIFTQHLVEAGVIGFVGGALGLGIALLGLWAIRQRSAGYADLAQLDPAMLVITFVLAVVATLVAGMLPAWRACQVTPAIQLKSQ
ncbi:ABC transporter permease [Agrilutibacter solisilvae]|uniref:ABC transporter permease n=1 Tax=Agrilutibacter solisilvae TaxID=2763317 RepID=A0A975AT30_9GAMM|nr:ABC transporter permease [Lysobacter solisilvae]QSX79609.1 ABC transporter permease [Lysobacter solisilvae]